MASARARVLLASVGMLALAGGSWLLLGAGTSSESTAQLAPPGLAETLRIQQEYPPPFEPREIRRPDPNEPAPSQTAAFCADENWSRLDMRVSPGEAREFRVDPVAWKQGLTETRAGIASWLFYCKADGQAVYILAADSGVLLATYDADSGLRER